MEKKNQQREDLLAVYVQRMKNAGNTAELLAEYNLACLHLLNIYIKKREHLKNLEK